MGEELFVEGTLKDSVDNNTISLTTGGAVDWFWQAGVNYDDKDSAQSGDIKDLQESFMEAIRTGPKTLQFYWKVSSTIYDYLQFFIDDIQQD